VIAIIMHIIGYPLMVVGWFYITFFTTSSLVSFIPEIIPNLAIGIICWVAGYASNLFGAVWYKKVKKPTEPIKILGIILSFVGNLLIAIFVIVQQFTFLGIFHYILFFALVGLSITLIVLGMKKM